MPALVVDSDMAASDRESVGGVVIVFPFDRCASVQDSDVGAPEKTHHEDHHLDIDRRRYRGDHGSRGR